MNSHLILFKVDQSYLRIHGATKKFNNILLNNSLARINKNYFLFEQMVQSYKISAEMTVWYVVKLRKQLVYLNWISTASFVALNNRGVKKRVSTPLMAIQN